MNPSQNETTRVDLLLNDLTLNKSKISFQKNEINFSQLMLIKIQENIAKHKKKLNSLISERDLIMEEKSYIKSLREDEDNGDCEVTAADITNDSALYNKVNKEDINSVSKIELFSNTYEIIKSKKSQEFYNAIKQRLLMNKHCKEIVYFNATLIPNELKISTSSRTMILSRIDSIGEYPLTDIIAQATISQPLELHISTGSGELLSLRGEEPQIQFQITTITSPASFFLLKSQMALTRFILLVSSVPMFLSIEVHKAVQDTSHTLVDITSKADIGYSAFGHQKSFLKQEIPLKEVRNKLVFLEAHFAEDIYGCFVPLSLSVVNYHGDVLLSTLICPRTRIKNYCSKEHGLCEKDLLGKPDGYDIMNSLHNIVLDKILVGHDLRRKIKHLKIDISSLFGVRELQASFALKKIMHYSSETWNIEELSAKILKQPIKERLRKTEENVEIVRRVYIAIESHWQDTELNGGNISTGNSNFGTPTFYYGAKRRKI